MYNGNNNSYQNVNTVTGNVDIDDDTMAELHAQLSLYTDQALGYHEGELGVRARRNWEYYYGDLPVAICTGSSSWVDRTVWESVNGVVQELSNVFTSGEEAVKFQPVDSSDGPAAQAATKMVNKILLQENNGYKVLNDAFKDACVTRNAFIKRWWEEREDTVIQEFSGLTEDQVELFIAALEDKQEDSIVSMDIDYDEETGLGDGSISYREKSEGVRIDYVPFEQVLIEPQSTSLKDTNYLGHRVRKTKDELLNMGFDEDTVKEMSPASTDIEAGVIANERIDNISPMNVSDVIMTGDEKADKLWLYENYLKTSILTGELELLQVFTVHGQILEINRVSEIPFDTITPFPIPGFVYGESVADITKDIQDLNTFVVRGQIDNIMNANFRRYTAVKGAYDRKSLLDNRPGGVVEIQTAGAVTPFPYHPLPNGMDRLLEYVEQKKEQRTGVTRLGQGLNADVFKNDNAEGMVNTMLSAASNRLRMVCRNIANTGMQDLMKGIYNLVRENGKEPVAIIGPKGPVMVEPSNLPERDEMCVSLAIGSSERQERGQTLITLFKGTLQNPATKDMMNPQQIYHMASEIYKSLGIFDVESYLTHPEQIPKKEPSPAEQMGQQAQAEQIKALQLQNMNLENQIRLDREKFEFEQQKTADDFAVKREKSLAEQSEAADKVSLDEQKLQIEKWFKEQSIALDAAKHKLEQQRTMIESQLESQQKRPVGIGNG